VSTAVAKKILCLPIYPGLELEEVNMIIDIIRSN
jgi:dTDP-4-amino-4,6-dideoxygalactose transaminase